MDFKNLLQSLDQLNEGVTTTKTGKIHTAEPGGYGRKDDEDEEGNKVKKDTAPKGRGRPKKNADSETGDVKKYDATGLNDLFGIKKPTGAVGKRSVKHSLKDWIETIDEQNVLAEAGYTTAPMPGAVAVKDATGKVVATAKNPQAAAAFQKGDISLGGEEMQEGDIGKHNNATTGFDALVKKLTPKYGVEAAKRIAGAQLKKIKEAEAPQHYAQSSPMSNGGRSDIALESKKTVKKDDKAEKDGKKVTKDLEYDMKHNGKDDNKAEKAGKKVTKDIEYDDKKKLPSMSHVKKMCKDGKTVAEICKMHPDCNQKELKQMVADCKKKMVKEGMDQKLNAARSEGKAHGLRGHSHCGKNYEDMEEARCYHEGYKEGLDECYGQMPIMGRTAVGEMGPGSEVDNMASYGAELDEMDKTAYMKQQAIKTPGNTFKAFGQTMHDNDVLDEFAFESLDKQLNALLEGKVEEGMTVSISKGQQGAPDSVSVSAQDGEADQLLSIIKQAGMGLFGGDDKAGYGAPQGSQHSGIEVVDDHDGMMALMKKLSGTGGETSSSDYADEEGHEEHSHEEDSCNECGMAYESCGCDHGDKEMVDEVQSEDQMTYQVAEDNPPDSGADNTNADVAGQVGSDAALATADAEENADDSEVTVSEDDKDLEESYANGADDTFEADIAYMTKIISGGLNKEKSTGQTTAPVIAGQGKRTGVSESRQLNESVNQWKKLAGIK